MEIVVVDGVEYMKVSAAAKHFHYTADYLGQLCRAKKLDARLVGRTWYVNPDSVADHKETRYKKLAAEVRAEERADAASDSKSERVKVPPVINGKTAKQVAEKAHRSLVDDGALRVSYRRDGETLIPLLRKRDESKPGKTIRVEQFGAKNIAISGGKPETTFTVNELPDIALSGKLTVTSFPDKASYEALPTDTGTQPATAPKKVLNDTQKSHKKNKISVTREKDTADKETTGSLNSEPDKAARVAITTVQSASKPLTAHEPAAKRSKAAKRAQRPAVLSVTTAPSFAPAAVQEQKSKPASLMVRLSPLVATFAAVLVVLVLWSTSAQVVAVGAEAESTLLLQVANLLELVR